MPARLLEMDMAREDDDYSDGEGADDDLPAEEGGGGRSGKRRLFLIIPVVLVLVGAGVGGWAYFTGRLQPLLDKMHSHEEAAAAPAPEPVYYDVPDVLVDLEKEGRHSNYLKLRASLLLEDKADVDFVDQRQPVVTDCFETHLRELRLEDLPRPGGMEGLRDELRGRLNQRLGKPVVKDVLLKEILVGTSG